MSRDFPDKVSQLALLIASGVVGRRLLAEMMEHFNSLSRYEVFWAVAYGTALLEADLIVARADLDDG